MATKELAQRLSGGDGILLLWHPESGRMRSPSGIWRRVTASRSRWRAGAALDTFRHPYAYADRRE